MSTQTSRINTLDEWFDAFLRPSTLTELAVLLACILLAWLGANEVPGASVLTGGALVIGALVVNELIGWRQRS
mgnify:CR=1 FL=1